MSRHVEVACFILVCVGAIAFFAWRDRTKAQRADRKPKLTPEQVAEKAEQDARDRKLYAFLTKWGLAIVGAGWLATQFDAPGARPLLPFAIVIAFWAWLASYLFFENSRKAFVVVAITLGVVCCPSYQKYGLHFSRDTDYCDTHACRAD